jgi:hypothetical protein
VPFCAGVWGDIGSALLVCARWGCGLFVDARFGLCDCEAQPFGATRSGASTLMASDYTGRYGRGPTGERGFLVSVSWWQRLAPLTGAGFVVLYFTGSGLIGQVGSTSTPTTAEIVDLLEDGPVKVLVGAYLSLVAAALLIWFAGVIRARLRAGEGETGYFSAVAFGGGVAAATAMSIGFAVMAQAALRAESDEGIDPEVALVFYDLYRSILGGPAPIGFAALIGATAVVSFRTRVFPRWLTWSSAIIAVGLISPLLFIFVVVAFIWVLVVSIWLFIAGGKDSTTDTYAEHPV